MPTNLGGWEGEKKQIVSDLSRQIQLTDNGEWKGQRTTQKFNSVLSVLGTLQGPDIFR